MNEPCYIAIAKLKDGRTLTAKGSVQECANWADNVIRVNGGCKISIEKMEPQE